jgi:hypothetical protein
MNRLQIHRNLVSGKLKRRHTYILEGNKLILPTTLGTITARFRNAVLGTTLSSVLIYAK